jgi:hypothetical protein
MAWPFIGAFLGGLGAGVAATFGFTIAATSFVAIAIGAAVVGGVLFLASKALKRQQKNRQRGRGPQGTLVTRAGSAENIPVIYGKRRTAGMRTFLANDGENNNDLYVVEAICEGPIKGCSKIYFNDELAATSSDDGASWSYEEKYSGKLTVTFYDGSQTAADGTLAGIDGWQSSSVGNKVAYVILKLTWDQETYGGGLPTTTYLVEGKLIPAIGQQQSSTLSYSTNPARVVYDYLTNDLYGKGIPYTLIDATSFNTIASYCDDLVDLSASDTTQVKRYETHAYIDTDDTLLNNLEQLFTSFRGSLITGDKYKLIAERPVAWSGVTIDDDSILGNIEFLQASKKSLINRIKANFSSDTEKFNYQEDFSIIESTTLQGASYDGTTLSQDISLLATTNKDMVNRIVIEEINQARQSATLSVEVIPSLIGLEVGDVVKFTNSTLGQTDKLYKIISTSINSDYKISLVLREYDPNTYWDNNKSIIINNKDDTDH